MYLQSRVLLKRLKPGSLGEITVEMPESYAEEDHIAHALSEGGDPMRTIDLEEQTSLADLHRRLCDGAIGWIRMPAADIDTEATPILMEDYPTLFLQFAELRLNDQQAILDFANKFGLLGEHNDAHGSGQSGDFRETLDFWILLQFELKTVIRLWRGIRAAGKNYNTDLLRASAVLNKKNEEYYIYDRHHASAYQDLIGIERLKQTTGFCVPPAETEEMNDRQTVITATVVMEQKLNNLIAIAPPKLKLDPINEAGIPKILRSGIMSLLASQDKPQAVIDHSSLFGAIALQLLDAINQDLEFNSCLECFKWMPRSKKGSGGNLYCGATCRNRASRRRRALSLLLDIRPELNNQLRELFVTFAKAKFDQEGNADEELIYRIKELSKNTQGEQSEQINDLISSVLNSYELQIQNLVSPELIIKHLGLSDEAFSSFFPILAENLYMSLYQTRNWLQPSLFDWSWLPKDDIENLLDAKDEV